MAFFAHLSLIVASMPDDVSVSVVARTRGRDAGGAFQRPPAGCLMVAPADHL
jgi:hypothetical protein